MRHAVQKVHCAVQRVDDPAVLGINGTCQPGFLAEKGVVTVGALEHRNDLGLCLPVYLGDEVVVAFAVHLQRIQAAHALCNHTSGGARGADADVQHRMHGQ